VAEKKPPDKFTELLTRLAQVPKEEIDREEVKHRQTKKRPAKPREIVPRPRRSA